MKLEQQVCSLDLAKQLKELGVKQESLFDWVGNPVSPSGCIDWHLEYGAHRYDAYYATFTVAELGEMLRKDSHILMPVTIKGEWRGPDIINNSHIVLGEMAELSEADARAKMLIFLIENKAITV